MQFRCFLLALSCSVTTVFVTGGCNDSNETGVVSSQHELVVLATEPEGAVSVSAVKSDAKTGDQVVVFGAVDFSETADGNSAFFTLKEFTGDRHSDVKGHDPSNCPFCKRELANAPGITVVVKGEDGNPLAISPQELLDVAQGEVVVIQGTAEANPELDMMVIDMQGIHRKQ
ncbi:MAG: hypothetical protein MPJ50_16175 [Pirellulales bacterium]|nr:hypothetical protein [Pirellulales bacterium]